jgi:hypothetical protein
MFEDEVALTFKRQLGLILLVALIGFVPATANTWIQSSFQRRDLLYGRRLAFIRDLSLANIKGASILAETRDLQRRVDALAEGVPSAGAVGEIEAQRARLNEQEIVWEAQLKAQLEMANTLYPIDIPIPGSENYLTPFSPNRPSGRRFAKIHDQLETEKADIVSTMRHVQYICADLSVSLNR